MTAGEKIKQARIAKGLTQDDLAAALGISKSAVSRCEQDQRQFRVEQLYTLSKLLDIPVYELVNLSPEKREELEKISRLVSEVEERNLFGEYISEDEAWVPEAMSFLRYLIERELAAAVSEDNLSEDSAENPQEPEFKKRKRRAAKLTGMFDQLNDAGQLNLLEYARVVSLVPDFQLQSQKPDVYSGLTDEEGTQLRSTIKLLQEAKYERYTLMDDQEPEDSDRMQSNAKLISDLNEKIAKIILGAAKRNES